MNGGLRYALQMPFYAMNNSYSTADMAAVMGVTGIGSRLRGRVRRQQPRATCSSRACMTGAPPVFNMLTANTTGYNTDKNNLAPSVGVAWTVGSEKGFLQKILGAPGDSVLRGGYSIAYKRPGTSDFTGVYGSNPGVSIDATRNQTNGNLGTLPVLLSSSDLSARRPST